MYSYVSDPYTRITPMTRPKLTVWPRLCGGCRLFSLGRCRGIMGYTEALPCVSSSSGVDRKSERHIIPCDTEWGARCPTHCLMANKFSFTHRYMSLPSQTWVLLLSVHPLPHDLHTGHHFSCCFFQRLFPLRLFCAQSFLKCIRECCPVFH